MARKRYYESAYREAHAMEEEYGEMMPKYSSEHAAMPQESFIKNYPSVSKEEFGRLNDSITGIDRQIKGDKEGRRKPSEGKY